jgi:serine/threonine-protein kinase
MMVELPPVIGPYRVIRPIGKGGMGTVFEAENEAIERRVAIKVLRPELAGSKEMASRFVNEARAVNRVDHPGIVQVSDHGVLADGTAYIVMELLKGETLAQRIERRGAGLSVAEVLHLGWQLADSLAAAHAKGIIHRDLKPENIMLVPDPHVAIGERAKLLDFGLAKLTAKRGAQAFVTSGGQVMGTPLYMSPERASRHFSPTVR